jgi:hypothetical protein
MPIASKEGDSYWMGWNINCPRIALPVISMEDIKGFIR